MNREESEGQLTYEEQRTLGMMLARQRRLGSFGDLIERPSLARQAIDEHALRHEREGRPQRGAAACYRTYDPRNPH